MVQISSPLSGVPEWDSFYVCVSITFLSTNKLSQTLGTLDKTRPKVHYVGARRNLEFVLVEPVELHMLHTATIETHERKYAARCRVQ